MKSFQRRYPTSPAILILIRNMLKSRNELQAQPPTEEKVRQLKEISDKLALLCNEYPWLNKLI